MTARQSRFRGSRLAWLVLLAVPGWLAAAPTEGASASAAAAAEVVVVQIRDNRFDPPELRVRAGATVRWVNAEKRTSHSVLFTGTSVIESDRLFPGEHFERRFDKPGRYPYTCGPHPEMHGVVEVEP
jgi:plastocyanin